MSEWVFGKWWVNKRSSYDFIPLSFKLKTAECVFFPAPVQHHCEHASNKVSKKTAHNHLPLMRIIRTTPSNKWSQESLSTSQTYLTLRWCFSFKPLFLLHSHANTVHISTALRGNLAAPTRCVITSSTNHWLPGVHTTSWFSDLSRCDWSAAAPVFWMELFELAVLCRHATTSAQWIR